MLPVVRFKQSWRLFVVGVLALIAGTNIPTAPTRASSGETPTFVRGSTKILRAGAIRTRVFIPPPPDKPQGTRPASATFEITYEGFPTEARTAFQYAADIWARQLTSTVPIKIRAVWMAFEDDDILAGSEPHMYTANFANAPRRNTLYPIALANNIAGYDLITRGADAHDIDVYVNSARYDWSFRTDGDWRNLSYDLATVVLHEIGHGLGFSGSMTVEEYVGRWGGANGFPEIYDRFTVNEAGQSLIDTSLFPNPSRQLYEQLVQPMFWNGQNGIAAAGGVRPELWTAGYWEPGSSYAHLSEYVYKSQSSDDYQYDALMTPYLDYEEVIHDPGPITRGILRDLGWTIDAVPLPGRPKGRIQFFGDYVDYEPDPDIAFTNTNLDNVYVYNYDGVATSLRIDANGVVVFDGPFTSNARRFMQLSVDVPAGSTCEPTTITGRLGNADGESEPFGASITVDGTLQTSATVTKPLARPSNAPAEGPLYAGDPAYTPSDSVRVLVPDEVAGCAGLESFTLVYNKVPQGDLPSEYGEYVDLRPWETAVDKVIPILGTSQQPIVPGVYEFHVDLGDKVDNRVRFPSREGRFHITVDTTPPQARLDPAPPAQNPPTGTGMVSIDLRNLRVTDDLYPDQGQGQPYWGYWVLVKPTMALPPTAAEWQNSGVVVAGRALELLWRISAPTNGSPPPSGGYTVWVRVLDGAGNASAPLKPAVTPVLDPQFVHLPYVQR
jgi:hypothetical protein